MKSVPIRIKSELHAKLQAISTATDRPIQSLADEALVDFFTHIEAHGLKIELNAHEVKRLTTVEATG